MLNLRLLRFVKHNNLTCSYNALRRSFHDEFSKPDPSKMAAATVNEKEQPQSAAQIPGAMRNKFMQFRDEDSTEIFDVEEEKHRYMMQDEPEPLADNMFLGLNLKRGLHGVFDIEDLVDVLRRESGEDIFVCAVPKELNYVDYMVVCSGRSYRHMLAMAEFVRRVYKVKRTKGDLLPKIEGEKSRDWMALDLGNIALHIFAPQAREQYDLESLWAIGAEYDKECNKPQDPLVELFTRNSTSLWAADIKPQ